MAVKSWLNISGISEGILFSAINRWGHLQNKPLTPDSINLILKSLGKKCQFDFIDHLSSHSARRGFATVPHVPALLLNPLNAKEDGTMIAP